MKGPPTCFQTRIGDDRPEAFIGWEILPSWFQEGSELYHSFECEGSMFEGEEYEVDMVVYHDAEQYLNTYYWGRSIAVFIGDWIIQVPGSKQLDVSGRYYLKTKEHMSRYRLAD